MKTPIELLNEVHEVGKEHPDLFDAFRLDGRVLVAAMVKMAKDLEDFKKSKPVKSADQEEIPQNLLTRGALQKQLHGCLAGVSLDVEKERALKIHNLLKSL
jgi:hypothetical protein